MKQQFEKKLLELEEEKKTLQVYPLHSGFCALLIKYLIYFSRILNMASHYFYIFQEERDKLLVEIKKLSCVPYVQNKKIQDAYSDKLNDLECQVGYTYNIPCF
jgi:hypothetical protein